MTQPDKTLVVEMAQREQEVAVTMIVDLIERMEKADQALTLSAGLETDDIQEQRRLNAKATGVRLCLSYAREALTVKP